MEQKVRFTIKSTEDADTKDTRIDIKTSEPNKKEIEEKAEQLGFENFSQACRYFINIGMHSFQETDPRRDLDEGTSNYTPLTIRDVLPDEKENALNMRDGEVRDAIDELLAEEISQDPKIKQEGWEVWMR